MENVTAVKLLNEDLMQRACDFTRPQGSKPSNMTLDKIYQCEHSPMRTQIFWVEMFGILSFVSVHLVRHNVGVTHFVQSMRNHTPVEQINRFTPINHAMLINAQALVNMSRQRLCSRAAPETREVWNRVKEAVGDVDAALAKRMVPECVYRGECHELKSCRSKSKSMDKVMQLVEGVKIHCAADKFGVERYAIKKDNCSLSKITGKWRTDPQLEMQGKAWNTEYRFDTFEEAVRSWGEVTSNKL